MSEPVLGWKGCVGIGEEYTYGVAPALPSTYLYFLDEAIRMNPVVVENDFIGGRDVRSIDIPGWTMGGTIKTEFVPDGIGWLLKWALGTVTSAAIGALYKHTFSLANTLKSFTVEADTGDDLYLQKLGCMINTLTISAAQGKPIEMDVNIMGKREITRVSSLTPTYPAKEPLYAWDEQFTDDEETTDWGGGLYIDTVQLTSVKSVNIEINNGLLTTGPYHGGGGYNAQPAPGKRKISFKAEIDMLDSSFYDMLIAAESHTLKYSVVASTGTGVRKAIMLESDAVKLVSGGYNTGAGIIPQSLQFDVIYDATNTLRTTLVNSDVNYNSPTS